MNGFNDTVGVPLRNFDRNKRSDFGKCIKNLVSDWSTALVDEYNEDRNKSIKEMLYLKPCIESSTLKYLENKMKTSTSDQRFELHQDFQLLYSIMNGQDFTSPVRRLDGLFNATPLFGVIQVYDLELLSYFVSIDLILQFIDRQTGRAEEDLIQKGNIPIVIAPGIRGHKKVVWYFNNETGQIISPRTDIRTDDFNGFYVVAESIFEMIEQASHMISQTASRINQGEKLADVCGFINPVTKRTGPFEVTVRVAFLYNESSIIPPHFHYGYEITQRMDKSGDSKESMRLERRYWKIDSLNDHIDEVDGPGVIGEYPELLPGTSHTYASRTSFGVPKGKMGGFFTYRKMYKDACTLLHTPTFELNVPKMIDS